MKYVKIATFFSLLLTAFVNDFAFAQGERKLKQELYFHKGENYKAISYDTLGRRIFRLEKFVKKIPGSGDEVWFLKDEEGKETSTTFYGRVIDKKKFKRNTKRDSDGYISIANPYNKETMSSTTYVHEFNFENLKIFYNLNELFEENIQIIKSDSATFVTEVDCLDDDGFRVRKVKVTMPSRTINIVDSSYINAEKEVLYKELTTYQGGMFIGKNTTEIHYKNDNRITLKISYSKDNEIIDKNKIVEKLNSKGQVTEGITYYSDKKKGLPDVYVKSSRMIYTYFDPYVEKRTHNCYNKKGKPCKPYTIEIKKSFY